MPAPTLIPRVSIDQIPTGSERAVARALLQTLDQDWVVFHSYSWLRSHVGFKKQHLREGEADFVLLHPKWGLLVLEVKGGAISYDAQEGAWGQNHHGMKDPFKQAQGNMHALLEQISDRTHFSNARGKGLPCTFGYAVAFPACNFEGTLPPGAHPSILFGARDLPNLGDRVQAALKHWSTQPQPMTAQDFKALKGALTSSFRPIVSITSRIEEDEELLIRLTSEQTEQLMGLLEAERAAVEGVAGSGKTLLALLRAEELAREGAEVLFLCYNKKLAESLSQRTAHVPNLKVVNFHRLCHDVCVEAKMPFEVPADFSQAEQFWGETAPELLSDALDRLPSARFDALVVDEAQDFQDLWWLVVERLLRQPEGQMYIFYDRSQNVYGSQLQFPINQPLYRLKTNCRNTRSITAGCSNAIGEAIRSSSFAPQGEEPTVILTDAPEQVRELCKEALNRYLGREAMSASRVAILSTKSRKKSCLGEGNLGRYALTDDLVEWESGKAVWFSTVKAFKGLEADVLILIEAGDFHPTFFSRQDLYVAASRAKHRLMVVTSSKEVVGTLKAAATGAGLS